MSQATSTVLLINPNRMRPPVAPLGLELLAAALIRDNITTAILDLAWERAPLDAIARAMTRHRPAVVGITARNLDDCYYASQAFLLPPIKRYARAVKDAGPAPVVLGGVGFAIAPEAALSFAGADLGVRGDGEEAFPALVKKIIGRENVADVPGLVRPGMPVPAPARARESVGAAPRRGSFDLGRYFRRGGQGNLETSRGCNRKCIYCADPVAKGRELIRREPERVAEEMAQLLALGVNVFHLCDSEFNLSRAHAEAVARAVIRAGLADQVKWYGYALPAPMDDGLALLLARAGCAGIDFSVDAADEGMLDRLGRDFAVDDLERCARAMRRAGIPFMYDLLLGGPGETRRTMATTIARLKKIRPDRVGVSFGVRVFPGTALAREALAAGPLADNPGLHGAVRNNQALLRPVFYVAPELGSDPESHLQNLIGGDRRFFFASRSELEGNYNYNNNRPLCALIGRGARGAYWDILRRQADGDPILLW